MEETQVDYAEVPVQANVQTSHASPDEIVADGKAIWKRLKAVVARRPGEGEAEADARADARSDALLEEVRRDYASFAASFPLVLRWMISARRFSARALRRFLERHGRDPVDSREAFLRRQAEYLVALFEVEARDHPAPAEVARYREQVVEGLLKEDKQFAEACKAVEAEEAAQARATAEERRETIRRALEARLAPPRA